MENNTQTPNKLDQLRNRDYILVIDRSGSMSERDTHGGKSRWESAQESTKAIANRCAEYDPDGITFYAFGPNFKRWDNVTPAKVDDVYREVEPNGGTNLTPVLTDIFNSHLAAKRSNTLKANGTLCIVVTDGQPSDEAEVARSIVNFTKQLDNGDGEFGLSFIQVGRDQAAAAFLKRLDDNLQREGAKFDIVDTKTMDEIADMPLNEVLIAALTD